MVVHGEGRSNHTGLDACVWRAEVPDERVLGVWDWAPSMFDDVKVQPGAYSRTERSRQWRISVTMRSW